MVKDLDRKDIDHCLYLVAREYKKANRSNPDAEIVLVGGASIILNYNFRNTTTDLDSIIRASSSMKDIILKIADEQNLNMDWMNDDFKKTSSYSPKLIEHSHFYKRFCNCLSVRTITDEYLLAMKIRSLRQYKHDVSDIIGIVKELNERDKKIEFESINKAYQELYNANIGDKETSLVKSILEASDLEKMFYDIVDQETENKNILLYAEEKYPNTVSEENVNDFLQHFKTKSLFSEPTEEDFEGFRHAEPEQDNFIMVDGVHSEDVEDTVTNRNVSDQQENMDHDYDNHDEEDIDDRA